jgi:hypothetical protein
MECAMTVANALLVSNRGILATIIPETLVAGEKYQALRSWMSKRFVSFWVSSLGRNGFAGHELGLTLMLAGKPSFEGSVVGAEFKALSPSEFVRGFSAGRNVLVDPFDIERGRISSSHFLASGQCLAVHCSGSRSDSAYSLRACGAQALAEEGNVYVSKGDIIVARVGRGAGKASVYAESQSGIATDCVFRIRSHTKETSKLLVRAVEEGRLQQASYRYVHGLGARFITKGGLQAALRDVLTCIK